MKPYVMLRTVAKNELEKDFLLKTFFMEIIRNHKDIKLGDKPKEIW